MPSRPLWFPRLGEWEPDLIPSPPAGGEGEGEGGLRSATSHRGGRRTLTPTLSRSAGEGAGLARESLYRSLSSDGNPEFGTVLKVMRALGLRLQAAGAPPADGN